MRTLTAMLIAASLSGCAFDDLLRNRVSCTVAGDEALYSSMYGWLGVTSQVDARDAKILCQQPEPKQ